MECQQLVTTYARTENFYLRPQHRHEKSYLKPLNYTAYHTNHPVGNVRGGTAIIMK
jgi:hypothetical protein